MSFMFNNPSFMNFSTLNQDKGIAAADTPATHMHRTMSLDDNIQSFFEKQTGQELSIQSLTKFMDDTLLRGTMTFTQHQDYHPIIDELVFYVTQWHDQASEKVSTNDEAQILLSFGLSFDIEDKKFWRIVKQLSEDSLKEVGSDTQALLDTITLMKQGGVLSNKALRSVSTLVDHLDTLSAVQLVDFTLMYSSSEM